VVAYKSGKKWATDIVKTTGSAAKLVLKPDGIAATVMAPAPCLHGAELLLRRSTPSATIKTDGKDLCFVTVTVADKKGLLVPRSKNHIKFQIEGPGEIVATDNGDATSFESFQAPEHNAYNGLALVIVSAKPGHPGTIKLTATADGLKTASIKIKGK
jgi:beta-galactosidase